ncbi:hypothetical protein CY34DRAFT_813434 [Suillus luteus UH-Slu-Lm8-n1]|uniref:BZIP domain-containing protein n=1 Tax=Suillus luteus UH-Slu-Lm8-n1 TaxID=930992 RepID=A0A0D0A659_9AGAM|nr:hypothetical protein CY34DRAFT_813434 [Suillus luteus UH-Slu-Lm8-n1]
MPQTRAKTTASAPTNDISSSSPAPATSSSPIRATPYTRSKGPAAASAEPINSTSTAQPRVRTPLTIRLPRASLAGHPTSFSITNNPSTSSLTASAPVVGIGAGAPIPTSSIRTPIPAPTPPVPVPPPVSTSVSQPTPTTPSQALTPALSPASSAPKTTSISSARAPAPPIYTFPPPPPPPNHVDDTATAARTSSTTQLPASVTSNANAVAISALSAQSAALAKTSDSSSPHRPTPPVPSRAPVAASTTLRPVHRAIAMASEAQTASRRALQAPYPTPSSAGALPSPASGADHESDYAGDAMEVDTEGISAMSNTRNNSTPKTSDRHREANKKYRQRLKERIKNGEIDELEAERMKERKRINARNSRARRKLAMRNEAAKDNGSMSSVEPGPLLGSNVQSSLPPPVDPAPGPGDFLLCLPETNPPVGSYYSTTFHEILTKADRNSGSSDGASITHPHFEPDSRPNFDFDVAMPPALFPLTKARDFRDACTMTDSSPNLPTESDIPQSLEPIAPALARRPHRQLTPERLRDFAMNPLQLIDKAFLLIVPDPNSTLGKLVLCKVLEYRVSSARHRFLVQFWGDKKASEMGVDRMMEVLEGGYEIDPPPAGPSVGPQGAGLAGRVFGALRSFTGF